MVISWSVSLPNLHMVEIVCVDFQNSHPKIGDNIIQVAYATKQLIKHIGIIIITSSQFGPMVSTLEE